MISFLLLSRLKDVFLRSNFFEGNHCFKYRVGFHAQIKSGEKGPFCKILTLGHFKKRAIFNDFSSLQFLSKGRTGREEYHSFPNIPIKKSNFMLENRAKEGKKYFFLPSLPSL